MGFNQSRAWGEAMEKESQTYRSRVLTNYFQRPDLYFFANEKLNAVIAAPHTAQYTNLVNVPQSIAFWYFTRSLGDYVCTLLPLFCIDKEDYKEMAKTSVIPFKGYRKTRGTFQSFGFFEINESSFGSAKMYAIVVQRSNLGAMEYVVACFKHRIYYADMEQIPWDLFFEDNITLQLQNQETVIDIDTPET